MAALSISNKYYNSGAVVSNPFFPGIQNPSQSTNIGGDSQSLLDLKRPQNLLIYQKRIQNFLNFMQHDKNSILLVTQPSVFINYLKQN